MSRVITAAERRARLAIRHRLADAGRVDDIATIAESVVALHSTDPATVYLSAIARMATPSLEAVTTALYDERNIIRHHGMRRTVWVCTPPVARAVHAACTVDLARNEWKALTVAAERAGIPQPDTWIAAIRDEVLAALHRHGPMSARQLGTTVPELTRKIPVGSGKYIVEQAAHTRILQNLGFDATLVRTRPRSGWNSSEYTWAAMDDWLPGGLTGMDTATARTELVGRYVSQFGPVTTADVCWWTGLSATPVKAALAGCAAVAVSLADGTAAWVAADDVDPVVPADPWVALLPSLDPTAMGWKERSWYLGPHTTFPCALFDRNGNIGPTVWLDGRVVGAWAQRADGRVVTGLLEDLAATDRGRIDRAAAHLTELIADTKVTPRFPTPLQKELAA